MKYIYQFLTLAAAIGTMYLILNTVLSAYMIVILAALLGLGGSYFLIKRRWSKKDEIFTGSNIEVYLFILVILLAIFLTDGFNSYLFFLIYLLPFGIAILFEPVMSFILLAGLLVLFISNYINQDLIPFWLQFIMLFAVTPISFFFGKEFHRREKMSAQMKESADVIYNEANELKKEVSGSKANEQVATILKESSNLKKATK